MNVGSLIDEALQLQTLGHEKMDVILHLLKGFMEMTHDLHYVGFFEPHRYDSQRAFIHILCTSGTESETAISKILSTQNLITEKTLVLPPLEPPATMTKSSVDHHASHLKKNVKSVPSSKPARRRWSFRFNDSDASSSVSFFNTRRSESRLTLHDLTFQVYEVASPLLKPVVVSEHVNHSLPKNRGHLFYSLPEGVVGPKTQDIVLSITNALYVIQTLYRRQHEDRGRDLKERIFNEIVDTLTMPMVVFDTRTRAPKTLSNVDPKYFVCTYYNDAFERLVESAHSNVHNRGDDLPLEKTALRLIDISPQDQQYKDENHHAFAKFLSHPKIYEALQLVMQQYPLKLAESFEFDDFHLSGNVSLGSGSRSNSGQLERPESTGGLGNAKQKGLSQTVSMRYGDDIIPKSDYEIEIYRVNGSRVGMVIRDVSEKIHHLRLIEQASEAKSEFLANINHEFRTPLNSIDGNLQLLSRTQPLTDRQKDLIHRMRLAETALMSLLQEVLDYAKLEQHKIELHNESFSLRHCLQAAIDVMQSVVSTKHNTITYEMEIDVPTIIVSDSWRLQQILVNLITNANNFTENGKIEVKLSRRRVSGQSNQDEMLVIKVSDTGIGIDPAIRKSLFLPWVQAKSTIHRAHQKGTGLGLAICKELCSLMGGEIWLDHTLTEDEISANSDSMVSGTTFAFSIRLVEADNEENLTLAREEMAALKGKEILFLHPDNAARRALVKACLGWGVRPTCCTNADECRDFLSAGCKFDAMLIGEVTNCHMSSKDNRESGESNESGKVNLATWITMNHPELPMIAIGNDLNMAHHEDCVRLFRTVISKPVSSNTLFHLLVNMFMEVVSNTNPVKKHSHKRLPSNQNQGGNIKPTKKNSDTTLNSLNCLVVEDVKENKQVLVEMLNELGYYTITQTNNGREMLDTIAESETDNSQTFDVIFVDLLMPVMDGLTAVSEYRKTHPLGTRPFVVAVTATNILSNEKASYQKAGMDAFIQKPIKMNELKALLDVIKTA